MDGGLGLTRLNIELLVFISAVVAIAGVVAYVVLKPETSNRVVLGMMLAGVVVSSAGASIIRRHHR